MKFRKAVSPVISTIVLTSIMLIIAVIAAGFAINMFAIQSDVVEFEQAKNVMVNFAGIVESVASREGASGYVRLNPRSGGPYFVKDYAKVSVYVSNGQGPIYLLKDSSTNLFKIKGGSLSNAPGRIILRGENYGSSSLSSIIVNNSAPLGVVYVEQSEGAWIVLNFSRISVLYLGTFNFSRGLDNQGKSKGFDLVNMIQVYYINITLGEFKGSGSMDLVAKCTNITTNYFIINCPINNVQPGNNYSITFSLRLGSGEESYSLRVPAADENYYVMQQDKKYLPINTVIVFVKSTVEINVVG